MPMSNKKIILFAALLLIFGSLNAQALEITTASSVPPPDDFLSYARFLYPFALSVAAVLAVIMIIIAGLEMMTASEGLREDAKKKIWGAVLGLLLAVGTFLILRTINPQLLNLRIDTSRLKIAPKGEACPPGQDKKFCPEGWRCLPIISSSEYACWNPLTPPPE